MKTTDYLNYIQSCKDREEKAADLAKHDFRKINHIFKSIEPDSDIHDMIMDIKIMRIKKLMVKHQSIVLSKDQTKDL